MGINYPDLEPGNTFSYYKSLPKTPGEAPKTN